MSADRGLHVTAGVPPPTAAHSVPPDFEDCLTFGVLTTEQEIRYRALAALAGCLSPDCDNADLAWHLRAADRVAAWISMGTDPERVV